ncbi:MAG: ABC transporter ATP-binding protein [Clostridia bacterium]|nr:ABC transporter ATP-binding protein [Clostridia bacterium]
MIEVKNLSKNYGPVPAVKNISFTVEKGYIYGFLGPNGAGKSTTMNMITGCLATTQGEITINGHDVIDDAVEAKRCIGYLPEIPPLYTDMTPFEYLEFVGMAKGLKKAALYDGIEEAMEKTGISEVADRLIKNLSKGYKQRVGIAQAIIGNPDIIILDEPTVGLDPIQILEIRTLIKELGREHTVILSSHILQEIEAVCDRVIMISKGNIVADDTLEALTAEESLEEAFVRLAGESLDAGAAYAMEKAEAAAEAEAEKAAQSTKGKKKVIVDSDLGPAYYSEVYVDEEPEALDADEDSSEDEDEEYKPMFSQEDEE